MDNSHETSAGLSRQAEASRFGISGSAGDQTQTSSNGSIPMPETVTAAEVAKMIGRSVHTVYRRESLEVLPKRIRDGGSPALWNLCEILAYMESIGLKAS